MERNFDVVWTNPETGLPEDGEKVIFKTKIMHNTKVHIGVFKDGEFFAKGSVSSEPMRFIWGWIPFNDTGERE